MRHRFAEALDNRRTAGRLRIMHSLEPGSSGMVRRCGHDLLDMSSNDYLGMARHPLLAERASEWARKYGTGSRASRLVSGTLEPHRVVEEKVAAFKGTEAALLFASGWQANAALFPALMKLEPKAQIIADWLIHASIHHGVAAARTKHCGYQHNDLDHLEHLLAEHRDADARIIATESVFSMDGDRADLAGLMETARRGDAFVVVDEAHATGVFGPRGAGLCADLDDKPDIIVGTFSKALGGFGAYIAASSDICNYLANTASGFVYSTAPPPPVLGAMDAALDLVPGMDAERARVLGLSERLRSGLCDMGFDICLSDTQIVPLLVGTEHDAMLMSAALENAGILAIAIRPPTVAEGESRIRFSVSAAHNQNQIDHVLGAMERLR